MVASPYSRVCDTTSIEDEFGNIRYSSLLCRRLFLLFLCLNNIQSMKVIKRKGEEKKNIFFLSLVTNLSNPNPIHTMRLCVYVCDTLCVVEIAIFGFLDAIKSNVVREWHTPFAMCIQLTRPENFSANTHIFRAFRNRWMSWRERKGEKRRNGVCSNLATINKTQVIIFACRTH